MRDTRSIRRRLAWLIPLGIVLGLATTVAVSWALVMYPFGTQAEMVSGATGKELPFWTFRQWRYPGMVSNNYGPAKYPNDWLSYEGVKTELVDGWSVMTQPPRPGLVPADKAPYTWFRETASGWPLKAMKMGSRFDGTLQGPKGYLAEQWMTVNLGTWGKREREVPVGIIWPGMLGNTALYASVWCVWIGSTVASCSAVRRWRRWYDLRGAAARCPECGHSAGSEA